MALKGKKVVITRDIEGGREFSEKVSSKGGIPILLPVIEFKENFSEDKVFLNKISTFDIFIFPSKNSVKYFFNKILPEKIFKKRIFAVGNRTRKELFMRGLSVEELPEEYTGSSLSSKIRETSDLKGKKILIPSSNIARRENYYILEKSGGRLYFWTVYLNLKRKFNREEIEEVLNSHYITFFSPSAVSNFFEIVKPEKFKGEKAPRLVSIGPTTSRKLRDIGIYEFLQARIYNSEGVIAVMEKDSVSF